MRTNKHLEESSAIAIQSIWRGHVLNQSFSVVRYYASVLQAFTRKCMARLRYNRTVEGNTLSFFSLIFIFTCLTTFTCC
jgi:hypothetical protein